MEADRIPNLRFDLRNRRAGRDTSWQVWHVSRVVVVGLFDHDRVPHHFRSLSPACFSTLFSVPGAISSDGLPAIVTRPSLDGCLYCRCDPRVAIRNQPSFSTRRITSRTFTPDHPQDYQLHSTVWAFKSQLHARADLGWHGDRQACFLLRPGRYRDREVGGGRATRQPGQVRKEAALTSAVRVARQPPTLSYRGILARI